MSAMASSAATLFTARAGQGLGAALLSPAALSIITAGFHGEARAKAQAAWGAVGGAGAAIGVLVGGVLTQATDWRTIFYVNIPVAALLLVASLKLVPADTQKPRWRGLDLPGAALATTSLAAIVYGITQANSAGWTSIQTHLCGLGGVAGLIAFAVYERHTDRPLLRVESDRRPRRRWRTRAPARRRRLDLRAVPALLALPPERARLGPAQHRPRVHPAGRRRRCRRAPRRARHLKARRARPARRRVRRRGDRHVPSLPRRPSGSYLADILPGMLIAGLGLGVAVVTVSMSVLAGARSEEAGMISGLASTGHEIGGTLGIAIFSTIAAGASGAILGPQVATGIGHAFLIAALVATLASGAAVALLPRAHHFLAKLRLNPQAMPVH